MPERMNIMMKNRLTVSINGRMYTLVSEESTEYMNKLAECVNNKLDEIKKNNSSLLGERPIVLAALNICDELQKAESASKLLSENIQRKYDEVVKENIELRNVVNNSEYEIDVVSLRHQLDNAKKEIEELKRRLNK